MCCGKCKTDEWSDKFCAANARKKTSNRKYTENQWTPPSMRLQPKSTLNWNAIGWKTVICFFLFKLFRLFPRLSNSVFNIPEFWSLEASNVTRKVDLWLGFPGILTFYPQSQNFHLFPQMLKIFISISLNIFQKLKKKKISKHSFKVLIQGHLREQ